MGFYTQCGSRMENEQHTIPPDHSRKSIVTNRTKLIIGLIVSLTILILGTHQWLSSRFDVMKDLKAMDQAIIKDDSTAFLKHIEFNEQALLNKKSYFNYIKNNEWDTVKKQYKQFADLYKEDSGPINKVIRGKHQGKLFTLKQDSVFFGLYNTYTWEAIPTTLSVSTSLEQVQVTVEIDSVSQPLRSNNAIEVATLYPGTYNIEGHGENIYGTFTNEEKVNISASELNKHKMDFGAKTYPLLTNKWDAILFIDGENTGERLEDLEFIGPIPKATNPAVHAEWETRKGEVLQSEIIPNTDFNPAGIPLHITEDPRE